MPEPEPFKHWFNEARYRAIAEVFAPLARGFDRKRFLQLTLDGLEERELMDRVRQTAIALGATLPGTTGEQLAVIVEAAPPSRPRFRRRGAVRFRGAFRLGRS